MNRIVTAPQSPWFDVVEEGVRLGSGDTPLLLIGSLGSLLVDCAKEIHSDAGGGPFEHVRGTHNSIVLKTQLLGPSNWPYSEFDMLDSELPPGAVHRAAGGTLFIEQIDHCGTDVSSWLWDLLSRRRISIDGFSFELDSSTRVIASIATEWIDGHLDSVPQWLRASFEGHILVLKPLRNRPEDIPGIVAWFFEKENQSQLAETTLTREAEELLSTRDWLGDLRELSRVVNQSISLGSGEAVTPEICKMVFEIYQSAGMTSADIYRKTMCADYAQGLSYMGRGVHGQEVFEWVGQFPKVQGSRRTEPWDIGLRIVREISQKYYYSAERIRKLTRQAYVSLCRQLADGDHITGWSPASDNDSLPSLQAVLVNPLSPLKSSSGLLPHMAHLIGSGRDQAVVPPAKVADYVSDNTMTKLVIFCDDFAGTGQQIRDKLVQVLSISEELRETCEKRIREGNPIILGVLLGAAFEQALDSIRRSGPEWLPIMAHAGVELEVCDKAFSDSSDVFPEPELRGLAKSLVVDQIGKGLSPSAPSGFGDLQALVVTSDNVPNNTLPVIWRSGQVQGVWWRALFDRASTP